MVDYVTSFDATKSNEAMQTARYCLLDALGCGILALQFPACTKLMGPLVEGTVVPGGVRVPGTNFVLDPVQGAFNIGCMNRWLDFNDTWLAAEWGHPSDNLGAILSVADFVSRRNLQQGKAPLTMHDVLAAMIKAYELQGVMALENSFNRVGLDHVILVKVASTAVATLLLGGDPKQIFNAISNAWIDNGVLRTYRHFPNTGSRKSWAAGDACARAIFHALNAIKGEMGYPTALSAPIWGFYDVAFGKKRFQFQRSYGTYVMENILFKVSFPAEFHAQTAVECAFKLHPLVRDRMKDIDRIQITTHESAKRIIDKTGPLKNPADRDHCIQYMTAVALIKGNLVAEDYEDNVANDPRIDDVRAVMEIVEKKQYTVDYHDPEKRSISNAVQIFFKDGTATQEVEVEYPLGHRRRRAESIPEIEKKFRNNIATHFPDSRIEAITTSCLRSSLEDFAAMTVPQFMELWITS